MKINTVGLPKDLSLPFFAYGIFKPGQLAFPMIMNFLDGEPSIETIKHEMLYRDGFALICREENEIFETSGYLINFSNPKKAYSRIGKFELKELYEWKKIDVGGKPANALVGVKEDYGSSDNREYSTSYYNYRLDPFFQFACGLIKDTKDEFEGKEIKDMKDFFKIQMNFMLLWSIIERFCTLSYGHLPIGITMFYFAKEQSFKDKLKTITRKDIIYSSDTLEDRYLDSFCSEDSIKYYYTIRCNVVHKGKIVDAYEMNKLKYSLEELYGLFKAVYNDKLRQNNELLDKYKEKMFD